LTKRTIEVLQQKNFDESYVSLQQLFTVGYVPIARKQSIGISWCVEVVIILS